MKVEQAKQIVSAAIEQLSQALERGHSETLRNYLAAIGRFHRYSLRNVMLIASQNPTATHVAGFHTWHKLGRFVKKGEKGILILAPIVRAKNHGVEQTETDESSTTVGFRAAYVFDISQTDGQELPEIGNVNGILANTATGSVNSSLSKAFFSNTRRTSPRRAAFPQVARSRCYRTRHPLRNSLRWRMKSRTN